ncbi:MAG: HEAT repeat domain-containing protein [Planctomycetota bacterium]
MNWLLAMSLTWIPVPQEHIRHIDLYGRRTVEASAVNAALGVMPGVPADFDRDAARERLCAIDGIEDAKLILMLIPGNEILLVGLKETGAPEASYRTEPSGEARLPEDIIRLYDEIQAESLNGIRKGISAEDRTDGYALSRYEPARKREQELRDRSRAMGPLLHEVLRDSGDARHRAVAAKAIAYLPNKAETVPSLAAAIRDSDATVRNNAIRSLMVLADWANGREDFAVELDFAPLITLLESLEWTDRNKAAALLHALTLSRDSKLLSALRSRSIPALTEMARWHSSGHAFTSTMILGRLAGLEDEQIQKELREVKSDDTARQRWITELARRAHG